MQGAGFTLMELLVVITIMGILLGIALPSFEMLGKRGLRASAAPLATTLRLARQYAITHRTNAYVIFPDAGISYIKNSREVEHALRSYAVVAEHGGQLEYITDWRYLPEGIYFDDGAPSSNPKLNVFSLVPPFNVWETPFPTQQADPVSMPVILFKPDGICVRLLWCKMAARPCSGIRTATSCGRGIRYSKWNHRQRRRSQFLFRPFGSACRWDYRATAGRYPIRTHAKKIQENPKRSGFFNG